MTNAERPGDRRGERLSNLPRRRHRFRQMGHTVLFTVTRNTKLEVRIAQFGRAAHRAFVQRLGFASRTLRVALSPRRHLAAMAGIVNNFWSEKDQIIGQGSYQRHAIGIRADNKPEQ